jgi:YggT family protein
MTWVLIFIKLLCDLFSILIIIRAILSWFPINPHNPVVSVLNQVTEPILAPLRRIIPRLGMIDITPMVAIIILQVVSQLLL